MKKNLKKRLLTTTAILLTTVILLASGGSVIAICLLGGTSLSLIPSVLRTNNQTKKEIINQQTINCNINKNYSKNEPKLVYNISELNSLNEKDNLSVQETKSINNNNTTQSLEGTNEIKMTEILPKIETTDAITEKEKVNRLIRKREKIDKFKKTDM